LTDKIYELIEPVSGVSITWGYEAGSTEASGFDTYDEAKIAYTNSRKLQADTSRALRNALSSSGSSSHGHRHKDW